MALVRSSFNQQLNAVEWHPVHIHDQYGLAVLRFFKPTIISWASSTTIPILKKSVFEKIVIPVPPTSLQEKFAKRILSLRHLEEKMRSDLKVGADLFLALQSSAFEGRL
jgi:type I restriction enzyme, S subunit